MPEPAEAVAPAAAPAAEPAVSPEQPTAPSETEALDKLEPTEKPAEAPAAEPSAEKVEKPVAEAAEEKAEKPPEETKPPEEAAREAAEKALPENLRNAFKAAPELRGAYFRDKEYGKLFQNPQNAAHVLAEYEASEETERLWQSPNPDDHRQLFKLLLEENPEAYNSALSVLIQDSLPQYAATLEKMGRTDLAEAIQEGLDLLFGGKAPAKGEIGPEQQRFQEERQRFDQERTTYEQGRVRDFLSGVRGSWERKLDGHISNRLAELRPEGLSKWAEGKLRESVLDRVSQLLEEDRIFAQRQTALARSFGRNFTDQNRDQMINAMWARVRPNLDEFIADELSQATQQAVADSQARKAKAEKEATKGREPAASAGAPSKVTKESVEKMKQKPGETYEQFTKRLYDQVEAGQ